MGGEDFWFLARL